MSKISALKTSVVDVQAQAQRGGTSAAKADMKLADVTASLLQGTRPLGWLSSLSLGGIKVPYDAAHRLLEHCGFKNTKELLKPIRPAHAFRSALSNFEVENKLQSSVEKWAAESVEGKHFITYRRINADTNTIIEAHKVAEIELDTNNDMQVSTFDTPLMGSVQKLAAMLRSDFEERKTHYYRQHFYYILLQLIDKLDSIKWSDNSLYFVPTAQTKGLEQIEMVVEHLKPYKTTTHRSSLLCVPIPDVEAVTGPLQGGYRDAVEERLEASIDEQLNEMLEELSELMKNNKARDSTKKRRAMVCLEKLGNLKTVAQEYSSVLERKLDRVGSKVEIAESAIKKMVEI